MISVIIPTYNRPDFLKIAIESVLKQNFEEFEILVGRNGGCKVSIPDDHRIYLHEWEDNNLEHINDLIRLANGQFITILHDDDFLSGPYSLKERLDYLLMTGSDVIWTDWENLTSKGIEHKKSFNPDIERLIKTDYINTGTIMITREAIEKVGLFDISLRYNCDWDFKIRCLMKLKCDYLPISSYVYRKHGNQESERAREFDEPERKILKQRYKGFAYEDSN